MAKCRALRPFVNVFTAKLRNRSRCVQQPQQLLHLQMFLFTEFSSTFQRFSKNLNLLPSDTRVSSDHAHLCLSPSDTFHLSLTQVAHLSSALIQNNSLTAISLNNCFKSLSVHLQKEALISVFSSLGHNTHLSQIDLTDNALGGSVIQGCSLDIAAASGLKAITLDENNIGERGLLALETAITEISTLAVLSLRKNRIEPVLATAKRFGSALSESIGLTHLDLSDNFFSEQAALELLRRLGTKSRLTNICLDSNRCNSKEVKVKLEAVVHTARSVAQRNTALVAALVFAASDASSLMHSAMHLIPMILSFVNSEPMNLSSRNSILGSMLGFAKDCELRLPLLVASNCNKPKVDKRPCRRTQGELEDEFAWLSGREQNQRNTKYLIDSAQQKKRTREREAAREKIIFEALQTFSKGMNDLHK
jgi:hypothetical protein